MKMSVTQFPLPLENECHLISDDTWNHVCLNQTTSNNNCILHSIDTQKLEIHIFVEYKIVKHVIKQGTLILNWKWEQLLQWELHYIHKMLAQSYMHGCLSRIKVSRQTSHHTFMQYENSEQRLGVSLFSNFKVATLNRAFTVTNIVCHAQYCF